MPRRERPLEAGEGPLWEFAAGLRKLRQKAGNPPYRSLAERAHYSISTLSSAASGQRLPTLAVTLAYVRACEGDVEEWERRWRAVAERDEGDAGPEEASAEGSPYVGLRPLREQDAQWFFGREDLVDELADRLRRQRFVMVTGASGSGKSSLLRAGLVPRLRTSATVVVLTPGPRPLEECAVRLGGMAGATPGGLYRELKEDPRNLGRLLRQIAERSGAGDGDAVLIVDQFEETFTLCRDDAERDRFVETLVTAASADSGRCRVVLGVRADFYTHCVRNSFLVEAMRDAQVPVGPMSLDGLRRVVVEPARRAGLTVESALLATLTAQAHGQAAVLPLVSHALLQTWRRRRGNALTLDAFQAAGGLESALARTAEEFYHRLEAGQRESARRVFVRLTAPGDGTEDTRRPAPRAELDGLDGAGDGHVRTVLERAAAARLLTLDRERVELAHEALIRCWPRLSGWLAEDREAARTLRRLTDAAHTWEALGRDPGALYRGTHLDMAAALDRAALSGQERRFLLASLAARTAERQAARRHGQLKRGAVALLSVLLVLASLTAFLAVRAQRAADLQRDAASSQRAADKAAGLRTLNPPLAAQLALAAYRLSPTEAARGSVLSMFATPYATVLGGHTAAVLTTAAAPDGRIWVTGGADRTVRLFSAQDPHHPRESSASVRLAGPVRAVAVSAEGRLLAAGDENGTVAVWDIEDERHPRLSTRLPAEAGPVVALGFGPGGRTLATVTRNGIRLWQLATPRQPRTLTVRHMTAGVTAAAFTRDGRTLATAHADRTLRLWRTAGPHGKVHELSAVDAPGGEVKAVAFAPDGRRLATGGTDFAVRLWDVGGPRDARLRKVLKGHTDAVNAVGFSPDGRTLATGSTDATVRRWEVSGPGPARALPVLTGHTGSVVSVAFGPDGRSLATGSEDRTTRLWDLPDPALTGHTSSLYSIAFSPDGRLLASGSYDRTVRLWNRADMRSPRRSVLLTGHTGPVNSVAFHPDGRTLASGSADGTLRLWSLTAGRRPAPLTAVPCRIGHVNAVAFAPDGRTLATGGERGAVRLWDTTDVRRPRPLAEIPGPGAVDSVAFSPDGRTLAVAGRDRTAVLWNVTGRRHPTRRAVLTGHTGEVKSVAFAPDGRALATGSEDRTVRVWSLAGPGRPVLRDRFTGYTDGVMSVAFAPGGRMLAAASSDHTVRLYDVGGEDSRELAVLVGHTKPVDTLAFSPDGRTLATGSEDWTALLWDPDVQRVAARICRAAPRSVTRAEWRQYFPQHRYRPPC
ncbi:XRE family transcriptional regulator [Streptomyces sp. S.PNR 29]|uniref:nSTAND1 domain-containing NTPase n=1 Tax=Streptomyces sp. S.PNR 29 TaxID=2973805 RepID=UPI0025AF462D|nr:XRE family transcriptional regulator [Streptomyces sp. S.PNR 29]MDN0195301.1 XRE family transcriptional regulator [Streptomyces sp. S.PNR 29]